MRQRLIASRWLPMEPVMDTPYIAAHLAWCRQRNLSPTTIYQRQRAIARVRIVVDPLVAAEYRDLAVWWATLTCAPESRATMLSHVRQFYAWLVITASRPGVGTRCRTSGCCRSCSATSRR